MTDTFDIKEIIEFVDGVVYDSTERHLNDLQRDILQESILPTRQTYEEIAEKYNYSVNYVKQGVGPRLWRLLSHAFGETVNKGNVRSVINRYRQQIPSSITALFSESLTSLPSTAQASLLSAEATTRSLEQLPLNSLASGDIEFPQNSVPLHSPFYIERMPYERQCLEELTLDCAFIRIKAPRQMGKSSLLNRLISHAQNNHYASVLIDFQQADSMILGDLDRLLRWICASLNQKLKIQKNISEYWDEDWGSKLSCTTYFQECILNSLPGPLLLALDEVNEVMDHPDVARDFFSLIRYWHERTKNDNQWQKLRMVMVHSTEIYIPLDINQSPLNVGLRIELQPFSRDQVVDLVVRHGLHLTEQQLSQLMALVGGHPYLIRQALYQLRKQTLAWDELLSTAATDAGIYMDHLHRHFNHLQRYPELAEAFIEVLKSDRPVTLNPIHLFKLNSLGLVTLIGNQAKISCELYQHYFSDRLGLSSTPTAHPL
jgi:hypothetical protein